MKLELIIRRNYHKKTLQKSEYMEFLENTPLTTKPDTTNKHHKTSSFCNAFSCIGRQNGLFASFFFSFLCYGAKKFIAYFKL